MATKVIIEKGDAQLQDVIKDTPSTRVNHQARASYPVSVFDTVQNESSAVAIKFTEDDIDFISPSVIDGGSDGGTDGGSDGSSAVVGEAIVGSAVVEGGN